MDDQTTDADVGKAPDAQESQVFDADYVKQLREEAKANRLQAHRVVA